jgi:hypothetical protein
MLYNQVSLLIIINRCAVKVSVSIRKIQGQWNYLFVGGGGILLERSKLQEIVCFGGRGREGG